MSPSEEGIVERPAAAAGPGPRRRPRAGRWRRRSLALAFGLVLPLLALELGARLLWGVYVEPHELPLVEGTPLGPALRQESLYSPARQLAGMKPGDTTHPLYTLDERGVVRLRPGVRVARPVRDGTGREVTVSTDGRGLRTPHPERGPAPEEALEVLVVGDSMTFGEGVDDDATYPAQLEPLLAAALDRPVRVHNAGIVSLGQHEELALLEVLLPDIDPDLVLLQFTVANDVIDDMRFLDRPGLVPDPEGAQVLAEHPLLTNPLARWSRVYRLFAWRFGRHAVRYRVMVQPRHLDRAAALLVRGVELASPRPTAVLIAPSVAQVEGSIAERILGTTRINAGIARRLADRGVPALDPLEALRAADAGGERLYIPVDRHWNRAGHRVVAEQLAPFLARVLGEAEAAR